MSKAVSTVITLYLMCFLGYSMHYMLLTNLNIAITNMVDKPSHGNASHHNITTDTKEEKFHWNEVQQGVVLGSVFWLLWLSHPVGGIFAQNFGAKRVFGFSILLGSAINVLLPIAAAVNYRLLASLRMIQGCIVGLSFPSTFVAVPHWVAPHNRGKFLTCFLGISFGSAVTYFISGFIMKFYGWKAVFYSIAGLGFVWCAAWKHLMFDKPEYHPRLSIEDRKTIQDKTQGAQFSSRVKIPVPWRRILLSLIVHSNIIGQFGIMWTIFVITIYAPRYMSFFHHLTPERTGVWSSFPHLFRIVVSLCFAVYSDRLIKKQVLSTTTVRKLATFISHVLTGLLMICLAYFGHILAVAEIVIFSIMGLSGTAASGGIVGLIDISPNFGAILQGLCGVCSHTAGFLIPTLVGYLTLNQDTVEQWQKVFFISAAISILTGLQFIFIWDSRVQEWNFVEEKIKEDKKTLNEIR
ncbi:vesicular glutamate transporter 2-like [Planococcus citri]|uniref:vesicular glutamate transporter 2-like n=1 Tax=Planococcus citri TaxID=170843 RepID=UPI0031F8CA48